MKTRSTIFAMVWRSGATCFAAGSGFAGGISSDALGAGGVVSGIAVGVVANVALLPASFWAAGIVLCSTLRDSHAIRFKFIKCCGPMLSEVMLPPAEPQPSVMAGNKFVE